MVSPAPLAAANPPPLSYAERAKKAQNARPSPQVAPSRSTSQGASSRTANSTAAAPSSIASRPAGPTSPSTASKSSPSGPSSGDTRTSSASHAPAASSSKPTTPPATDHLAEAKPNGDVNHNGDSLSPAPSASSIQKQPPAPPVNVWNIRKEQMAARALNQPRSANPTSPLPTQNSAPAILSSRPSALDSSTLPASSSSTSPNPSTTPMKASPPILASNGHPAPPGDYDDPFVVRPGRSPPTLSPPTIDDAESWPEVGQAAATLPHASNGRGEGKSKEGDEERGHEREASQGHGSRKSEKTKWVPIPPEELQFERPNRTQQHQKHRPQNYDRNPRQTSGPSGAPSTSSGPGSQQQSRTHSSIGMRAPPSHAGSVSHSQAQSRTGSVHSSPRHSSIRGGGRRLPDDGGAPSVGASRSMRSSGPNSPATFAQPQPLPPQEFIPGARPFINTNVGRDASSLSTIPDSGAPDVPPPGPYYPPPVPPLGVSPYHSPQPAGSPAPNSYALPHMVYPGQPGMPAPVPLPGYGTPPYMYPPYPYGYGAQPYMYWPPPGAAPPPGMAITSPSAHPSLQSDAGIPPPTLMARPPPPNESEAVAGYREVGFTLPPQAEPTQSQQSEVSGPERGRRTRELSFGTIVADGSKSPGSAPGSPSAGGVGLELNVEGARAGDEPSKAESKDSDEKTDGKGFTLFSIGVAPGEPGPARLRSRTRTQSKGASAAVSGPNEGAEGEQSDKGAADPVVVLADAVAKVVDLTDPETKWEFGTTKQAEDVAEPDGEGAAPPAPAAIDMPGVGDVPLPPAPLPGAPFVPMAVPYPQPVPPYPPVMIPGAPVNGIPSAPSPSAYGPRPPASATEADEWEVRDYGYGFGRGGPPPTYSPRDDRSFRDRRDFVPQGERENYGRPRRGSYGQAGYDRGSYSGRRGRGLSGGYGGRGYSNRSFSGGGRGGYSNQGQQRQPPYVPPPPPQPDVNGYYPPPPIPPLATYIPSPYDSYPYAAFPPPPPPPQMAGAPGSAPPQLPVPQSQLLFPLDSTRYYLLGQLEYYLSTQNMARDFFLRQQMDSRGWIPIPLIASFNRVRTLTTDVQLVTDVLTLSSLVEVRDGHVRMHQWQQFVLPTARPSNVEPDDGLQQTQGAQAPGEANEDGAEHQQGHHAEVHNHDGEEDDEDVEFVL